MQSPRFIACLGLAVVVIYLLAHDYHHASFFRVVNTRRSMVWYVHLWMLRWNNFRDTLQVVVFTTQRVVQFIFIKHPGTAASGGSFLTGNIFVTLLGDLCLGSFKTFHGVKRTWNVERFCE